MNVGDRTPIRRPVFRHFFWILAIENTSYQLNYWFILIYILVGDGPCLDFMVRII